jgi:hypothetical protein
MHLQRPNYPKIIAKSQALSCRLYHLAKQARRTAARKKKHVSSLVMIKKI